MLLISSLPGVGRVRRSRERVRYNRIGVKSDTPSALCATSPILGEELVFLWWLSVVYSSLPKVGRVRHRRERVWYNRIGIKSNTPQSRCASSPNLGEQLFVDSQMFRCSISSPPRIGGVRRSREEVRKHKYSIWNCSDLVISHIRECLQQRVRKYK